MLGPNRCFPLALGLVPCLSLPIATIFFGGVEGGGWSFFFLPAVVSLEPFGHLSLLFFKELKTSEVNTRTYWTETEKTANHHKSKKPNTSLARKLICISPPHLLVWTFWLWRLFEFERQVRLCSASKWTQASWPLAVKKRENKSDWFPSEIFKLSGNFWCGSLYA